MKKKQKHYSQLSEFKKQKLKENKWLRKLNKLGGMYVPTKYN